MINLETIFSLIENHHLFLDDGDRLLALALGKREL
jgi:hypothetical protein